MLTGDRQWESTSALSVGAGWPLEVPGSVEVADRGEAGSLTLFAHSPVFTLLVHLQTPLAIQLVKETWDQADQHVGTGMQVKGKIMEPIHARKHSLASLPLRDLTTEVPYQAQQPGPEPQTRCAAGTSHSPALQFPW